MLPFDPALCLVTDRSFTPSEDFLLRIEDCLKAGVTWVQYREKRGLNDRENLDLAQAVKTLCHRFKVPFVVNDRLDLAMALGADGVHLGQSDLPLHVARRIWPQGRFFGQSVATPAQAHQAWKEGADYLGVGALFPTSTKPEAPVLDPKILAVLREAQPLPLVGIGGMTLENAPLAVRQGCAGIAVISALWGTDDPGALVCKLLEAVRTHRTQVVVDKKS